MYAYTVVFSFNIVEIVLHNISKINSEISRYNKYREFTEFLLPRCSPEPRTYTGTDKFIYNTLYFFQVY